MTSGTPGRCYQLRKTTTTANLVRDLETTPAAPVNHVIENEDEEESCEARSIEITRQAPDTWNIGRMRVSRSLIVYFLQVLIIYIVVLTSIYNLTRGYCNQTDQKLWVATLSSGIGYLLPNPTLTQRPTLR